MKSGTSANLLFSTPESRQVFRIESSRLKVFCALGLFLSTYNSQMHACDKNDMEFGKEYDISDDTFCGWILTLAFKMQEKS